MSIATVRWGRWWGCVLCALVSGVALADPPAQQGFMGAQELYEKVTAADLVAVIKAAGFEAEQINAKDAAPMFRVRMGPVRAYLGCGDQNGDGWSQLILAIAFKNDNQVTAEKVNRWNSKHDRGRAALGDDKANVFLDLTTSLRGGVTQGYLVRFLQEYNQLLPVFAKFLDNG